MEILDASRRTENPRAMEYAIAEPLGASVGAVREKPASYRTKKKRRG
jgi:hypothetical protein